MDVAEPLIRQTGNLVEYRVNIRTREFEGPLWYRLEARHREMISPSSDAPLLGLLVPAMHRGEDIHVAGTVSARLLHSLRSTYQELMRQVIPSLRSINVTAENLDSRRRDGNGVATGFSGGIDSWNTLLDFHYADLPASLRLTHLLFSNVGGHGREPTGLSREIFDGRYAALRPLVDRLGLPFVKVDSNLDSFYSNELRFQLTHTPRNASVALLLQAGLTRFMYSSAHHFTAVSVGPAIDTSFSDAVALPLLGTETLEMRSVGGEYTRLAKTLRVADNPDTYSTLDVCVSGKRAGNCSACWKCMRTMLTLDIAGKLPLYSGVFDLDAFERRKARYLSQVLASDYPLLREIVQFTKSRGYRFPLSCRIRSHFMRMDPRRRS